MSQEVYFVVYDNAGFINSVTIIDSQFAQNCLKQLRNPPGGKYRKVREFTNREKYLEELDRNCIERIKHIKLNLSLKQEKIWS